MIGRGRTYSVRVGLRVCIHEFVIGKQQLVAAILNATGAVVDIPIEESKSSGKRRRHLESGDELAEDASEKQKSTYLQDLDDRKQFFRSKTDAAKR